ncbi:post-PEP-CTERM-1 domain-containing protein [Undibacterium sp.]|jgi:hypothetical protein|uniref:post-PEP-CTERM-1 domain-containing protein n=1 Tax=Undibacterium sp. TaxID=1914977 RepID=UPI002B5BE8FE|nr:hypothetical protein [Undibacterium sp.]HTD05791.1 hypothetical protein [Undibacterium sp.]
MLTEKSLVKILQASQWHKRLFLATAIVTAIAAAPMVHAQESGMRVFKDPVTGKLRAPTAEEEEALNNQVKADEANKTGRQAKQARVKRVAEVQRPDGSVMVELDESTMTYSVATRNADGSINMECVTGDEAADKLVNSASSTKKSVNVSKAKEHNHEEK